MTTCPYCGCGCGLYLESLDGRLIGTTPSKTSPVNRGKLCVKGWTTHEFVHSPRRLTTPLVRKDGRLVEASWDEALDLTVKRLKEIKSASGPDAIGFFHFSQGNQRRKLSPAKIRQSRGGDEQRRPLRPSLTQPHRGRSGHSIRFGAMTNSIEELAGADTIFIIGSNTTASHPLVANRLYEAKAKGATLIVCDPRRIQMAYVADLYVSHKLGTDVALLNGIMHIILKNGWADQEFIAQRTEGFDEFKAVIEEYTPERGYGNNRSFRGRP